MQGETKSVAGPDPSLEPDKQYTYVPPAKLVMSGLGVSATDLTKDKVTVSTRYLKRLIGRVISKVHVDDLWYLRTYPDVKGAVLAHDVNSAREHFLASGYFESRLPGNLPFDPDWYYRNYKDIAANFSRDDVEGLRKHYVENGYFEGRAGTPADLAAAKEWL